MARLFVASKHDTILLPPGGWSGRLSFSGWVYLTSQPSPVSLSPFLGNGYAFLSSAGVTGYTGYLFGYKITAPDVYKLNFEYTYTSPGGDTQYSYPITLDLATWHHIAWTLDTATTPDTVLLYVNGALVAGQSPSLSTLTRESGGGDDPVNVAAFGQGRIGAWYSGAETWYMDGRLAEIALLGDACNPVLSPTEILRLYHGAYFCEIRPTWPTNHYQGAWPLEGVCDPEPDWSGNGRHSTSISGTTGGPTQAVGPPTAWYPPLIPGWFNSAGGAGGGTDCPPIAIIDLGGGSTVPVASFDLASPLAFLAVNTDAPIGAISCPPGGGATCD